MIYYISDLHLGDQRIFNLSKRPLSSLDGYENCLIEKWNQKVNEDDDVYILGDLANGDAKKVRNFFSKTKGRKHLILGNHDEDYLAEYSLTKSFVSINRLDYIIDDGRKVCICHYPLLDWFSGNEIIYHVFGHIHNKNAANSGYMYKQIKDYYSDKPAFNASVDVINFEPVTLNELIKLKEENSNDSYIN